MSHVRLSGLALTSVGLVAAAIIGVQLGQSAISDINPIHFQGPLERPRAITPPPEPAPYDPQSYVWSMPPPPLALADCGADCGTAQTPATRLALDEAAGRDPALPYWRDATPTTELRPWTPGAVPGRTVERYMHYPVDREQAERTAAAVPTPAPTPVREGPPAEALRLPPTEPQPVAED